ncbi:MULTISPECIES: hypothetical protein [Brucella/Ochrobactrum group]|uniref:helix-turn-helix domain-containing protein n=1 Tax=Brucella/Ochrobactrum group TaxID=2826938 RepID=UPI001E35872D|nr:MULTISPECIES: hypothetical protein [Brucella/Ochrobactrum group]MCQ9144576.1 hypothetical protein [Ochrobactrum sp. BTU2]UGQ21440.1 hypothetical protein LRL11_01490 [Brucella anthropi]
MLNPFTDPQNSDILKQRIQQRMDALGLNPSSVALHAELGRSAVRDILSGKAKSPKHITLYKIAEALECSASYLVGEIDTLFPKDDPEKWVALDRSTMEISGILEAGVYRKKGERFLLDEEPTGYNPIWNPKTIENDRRFPGRKLAIYEMGDSSLDGLHIVKGDIVTILLADDDNVQLRDGQIVVALNLPPDIKEMELSARLVKKVDGAIHLSTFSKDRAFRPIIIPDFDENSRDNKLLKSSYNEEVRIIGRAISLTRDFKM